MPLPELYESPSVTIRSIRPNDAGGDASGRADAVPGPASTPIDTTTHAAATIDRARNTTDRLLQHNDEPTAPGVIDPGSESAQRADLDVVADTERQTPDVRRLDGA